MYHVKRVWMSDRVELHSNITLNTKRHCRNWAVTSALCTVFHVYTDGSKRSFKKSYTFRRCHKKYFCEQNAKKTTRYVCGRGWKPHTSVREMSLMKDGTDRFSSRSSLYVLFCLSTLNRTFAASLFSCQEWPVLSVRTSQGHQKLQLETLVLIMFVCSSIHHSKAEMLLEPWWMIKWSDGRIFRSVHRWKIHSNAREHQSII